MLIDFLISNLLRICNPSSLQINHDEMVTDSRSEKLVCNSLQRQRQLEEAFPSEASKPHVALQTIINASSPAAASCCYNVSPQQLLEGSHASESGEEWTPQIKEIIIKKKILQEKLMTSPDEVTCYLRGKRQKHWGQEGRKMGRASMSLFSMCEEMDIKMNLKKNPKPKFWANYSLSLQFH